MNTFHHYFNSITAHVVASETREKTKLKRNHSTWIGLTLIDMTLIIRQYSWSKLHSPLQWYTICSNLRYDKNKLWLQQYSTANNSVFQKMTKAANKTTYWYFRHHNFELESTASVRCWTTNGYLKNVVTKHN